ncbi:RICIN domain-containing protein [Nocardia fusca]|uniref:RICIN domain-containing protein n=1 Tax=Nocardia fusca TaxID=941183 RepID=UPI0037C5D600
MTAPQPAPELEFKQQLKELVDRATQDGLSQARLAKQAAISASVLSKALGPHPLPSWDGVGKAIVSTCLRRIGPIDSVDLAVAQAEWEQRWKAARDLQQKRDQLVKSPAPANLLTRRSNNLAPRVAEVIELTHPDPIHSELAGDHRGKRRPAGFLGRVRHASLKTKVAATITVAVLAAGITVAVGLARPSNPTTIDTPAGPVTDVPSSIILVPRQGIAYSLGNGSCTHSNPDTRDTTVKLFSSGEATDFGPTGCASLLQWTLHRQSPTAAHYYITPASFPSRYLTADQDKSAVTSASQQWKLLQRPNKTWVIQAIDTTGGPRCLAALPDVADHAPVSLQPCRPGPLQDWTISPLK